MRGMKILATVLIGFMMLMFAIIWICSRDEKDYTWVWMLIESVYALALLALWG